MQHYVLVNWPSYGNALHLRRYVVTACSEMVCLNLLSRWIALQLIGLQYIAFVFLEHAESL